MKLLGKDIDKARAGRIKLLPQEPEDLWHAYNIIAVGDRVISKTIRKVVRESATGSVTSDRRQITLAIRVEKIQFEVEAGMLRLSGVNVEASESVKLGAHHTLELELNRAFTVEKDEWDSVALARVEEACDPSKSAEVAALVMGDGTATLSLITDTMTIVRAKVDVPIPKKRGAAAAAHEKSLAHFFDAVVQAVLKNIDFSVVKCVVVASPAFVKDQFLRYMFDEAVRKRYTQITAHKAVFVPVHCSCASGFACMHMVSAHVSAEWR